MNKMNNEDDECYFNEEKARKCVYYLLRDDVSIFKKLLPEIKAMDSQSFENLFQGIPFKNKNLNEYDEEGYDYKVKNKKNFEKLLDKFDNFSIILEDWYLDEKYYKYLKELWIKYISIENLKERDEKKLEEILKSNQIDYINWPDGIKDDFKTKINNTSNTRIMAIKSVLENELSEFNNVIQQLKYYQKEKEKKKEEGDQIYALNAGKILKQFLGSCVLLAIPIAYNAGLEAVDAKAKKALKKLILNNNKVGFNQSNVNSLVDRLLEYLEGETGNGHYQLNQDFFDNLKNPNDCYWFKPKRYIFEDEGEIDVYTFKGKLNNLNFDQTLKAFFKSNVVCGLHAALSFLNLGWSIVQLKSTCDSCKQVKEYKKNLDEITHKFNIHKNAIGILPDDFRESSKKIKEILELIWEDYKELQQLIDKINQSILFQKEQQKTAIIGAAASVALGTVGAVGSLMTGNVTSAFYAASTVGNVVAGVNHVSNFIESKKIVEELNVILTTAKEQSKTIQKQIDSLLEKLRETGGEIPKFNLSESSSSISTNE